MDLVLPVLGYFLCKNSVAEPFVINNLQDNALNGTGKEDHFSRQRDVPQLRELYSSLRTESTLPSVEFPVAKLTGLAWPGL